jgi:hypothetical protein
MAYDAYAGYIYQLDPDLFAEIIPDTYQAFLEVLEEYEVSTDSVAVALDCDDWGMIIDDVLTDEGCDRIEAAYKQVRRMFEAKTGLQIAITQIDEGSAHNDVAGTVWCVLNAVQPTPPAKKYENYIEQQLFCHFG